MWARSSAVEHPAYIRTVAGSNPAAPTSGRLAQLARALRLHRRSRRFESCIVHTRKTGFNMKTIYQDKDLLVIDKTAGVSVGSLKEYLPKINLPRNGIIHRLDKDTSGLLLIAKNSKSLLFFQNKFKNREVEKTYIALVFGRIQENSGIIKTLIGRDKSGIKQKAYFLSGPSSKKTGPRKAETEWKTIKRYKEYTLIEAMPKTGRKHQIRVHFADLGYPIAGDKLYSFKNQKVPKGLERQFLHAKSLKIKMMQGEIKEFESQLPTNLKNILCQIK